MHRINGEIVVAEINHRDRIALLSGSSEGAVMLRASPLALLPGFILGIVIGGIAYVFVMPHLSGYVELGLLLFGLTFGAFYRLWEPRRRVTPSVFMGHVRPE